MTIWAQLKIVDFFSNPSKNPEKNSSFSDTPVFAQQAQHSATHSPPESIGESNVTSVSSGLLSFHGEDLGNFLCTSHLFLSS